MEYRKINDTGLEVSRVGLGTWALGGWMWGGTEENRAIDTVHAALDSGINLIDTAPAYGFGRSEELVGKAIEEYDGDREDIVVSTKAGLEWSDEQVFRNTSRERLLKEVDDSLERLGLDYIDIYHVHWPDPTVPVEETAGTMKDLLHEGKIKAIGVSNYSTEQMDQFLHYAPIHVAQPPYNIFEREIEEDILPYCLERNIHTLTYGTLCRGLLTGKMDESTDFKGDDMRKAMDPKFQGERFERYLKAVDKLGEYAKEKYGREVIHLAIRWVLDRGANTALWGARKPEQLEPLSKVFDWELSEEEKQEIVNIVEEILEEPIGPEFMAPPSREETDSDRDL